MSKSRWASSSLKDNPIKVIPLEDLIVPLYNTKMRKQRKRSLPKLLRLYRKKQLKLSLLRKRGKKVK